MTSFHDEQRTYRPAYRQNITLKFIYIFLKHMLCTDIVYLQFYYVYILIVLFYFIHIIIPRFYALQYTLYSGLTTLNQKNEQSI